MKRVGGEVVRKDEEEQAIWSSLGLMVTFSNSRAQFLIFLGGDKVVRQTTRREKVAAKLAHQHCMAPACEILGYPN